MVGDLGESVVFLLVDLTAFSKGEMMELLMVVCSVVSME